MPEISDAMQSFYPQVTLRDVFYSVLEGRRFEDPRDVAGDAEANLSIGRKDLASDAEETEFRIALGMKLQRPHFDIAVVAVADYSAPAECHELINESLLTEFSNHIAVMTLIPYVRQAATDLGQRMGHQFTLPVIKKGELKFEIPPAQAWPEDSAPDSDSSGNEA